MQGKNFCMKSGFVCLVGLVNNPQGLYKSQKNGPSYVGRPANWCCRPDLRTELDGMHLL